MINDIVIHTCCADCLIHLIEALEEEKQISKDTQITILFYNPNIHPKTEYMERLNALKIVLKEKYSNWNMKLVIPDYKPKEYFESIVGREKRCLGCWELRLSNVFEYAKAHKIAYVTSTLLSSHYQDIDTIIDIAQNLEDKEAHLIFPKEHHEHSINKGFYKQNFCGCCYSLNEKLREKYLSGDINLKS